MKPRVAINGFGRIGRQVFRINLEKQLFDIVAINDLTDAKTMAHLLKYDSNFGTINNEIKATSEKEITIDGNSTKIFTERDPENLPWKDLNIDIVIESTGVFKTREGASKHIKAGAKRVVLSAAGKDLDFTVVVGVNDKDFDPKNHYLISNASCTTNCLAPVAKVIHENLEIEKALMTTVHAYTNDQKILDLPHKDLRRARAAALSMIPTTTGAAIAVTMVIPELEGKIDGMAIRVPTPTVSLVDFTAIVQDQTTVEEVNSILKDAANGELKGILDYTDDPLVSVDYKQNPHSSIVDGLSTKVMDGNMVKIIAWYDNEWGYSARMVDLVKIIGDKI